MKSAQVLTFIAAMTPGVLAVLAVHKEAPPNPDEVPLPAVPNMVAVGKSGFPELPTVSAMLDESTQTLSSSVWDGVATGLEFRWCRMAGMAGIG
ncbi:unnamed protein product [Durusdinium trenchii]|uniref:Secreted protein n=1 Tax=Durusdinium trenchii TaxID=1381693 RepID=A0ABP0JIN8_9DINO